MDRGTAVAAALRGAAARRARRARDPDLRRATPGPASIKRSSSASRNCCSARETKQSPFANRFKTNEPAHWVTPDLVAQVRFTEWTADRKLRHPVYLGLRTDKQPSAVVIERVPTPKKPKPPVPTPVVEQLRALEDARRDGTIELAGRISPRHHQPAQDLLAEAEADQGGPAPLLRDGRAADPAGGRRPAARDEAIPERDRWPRRSTSSAPASRNLPAGVRVETIADDLDPILEPDARRFIGGSLITLLYMTQIAAISQDPWFSRVQSPLDADYVAIDLDPGEGATFKTVLDVARLVHDELQSLKVTGVPKTSGSSGLHIYIPLAPGTSYESGMLFCQIVATVIASRHPKIATVERTVRARRKGTVYVDYLQNILGKTLATAYSARASEYAGVSTPLTWKEVFDGVDPRDFTIVTAPQRFKKVGDLWKPLRTAKPANLETVFKKYE